MPVRTHSSGNLETTHAPALTHSVLAHGHTHPDAFNVSPAPTTQPVGSEGSGSDGERRRTWFQAPKRAAAPVVAEAPVDIVEGPAGAFARGRPQDSIYVQEPGLADDFGNGCAERGGPRPG